MSIDNVTNQDIADTNSDSIPAALFPPFIGVAMTAIFGA
jgi:hypothetical protein